DVIFVADSNLSTLADLRYKKWGQAEDGHPGRGKQMTGRSGEDWRIKVPVGTLVKDAETGDLLVDLKEPFQEFVAVRGGRGGQGNARFKSSTNRAPRQFQKGEPGEQRHLVLELKLLADVGIIGFPNAGKSTLISKISHARPKIGDYPFTTLIPQLGVVEMEDFFSFVAADIPGLIEGAHRGKGLGIQFLKHTERTRLLLHLLDFSSDRDPLNDYHTLQKELECFSRDLYDKPQILVPTKMDDPRARERFSELESRLKRLNPDVVPISSVTGDGVQELLWDIKKR
ncbi:MAG: GTPase ObgE, partial [Nitrospinaceae bacterium]|nr:GTPase ObgE [Nitrospinaceae bacterium]NIR54302.1 GTPase ObgE [Nitrospinaceae bacterium]NIS84720.1 GTPase ObgE [Nitrospinaceae bacterium]NIT81521.1 GTPase ObgE [Nitrospinaceae bacterium]NIU43806.1 GTPase ObgE [Nitrospinaceae bacterium]